MTLIQYSYFLFYKKTPLGSRKKLDFFRQIKCIHAKVMKGMI